jgi:ribosomal protein L11 methylase PrmA
MAYFYIYLVISLLEIFLLMGFFIYVSSMIYSYFKGSFYVPTKTKVILNLLKEAELKKNQIFYDLGCGDGRMAIEAAKNFKVKAIGIDVNPILIKMARFKARLQHIKNVEFKTANILKTDFSRAQVIYIFLMPELIKKLKVIFEKQLKKPTLVISHGFKIVGWERYLQKTIPGKTFATYYYRFGSKI